MEGFILISSTLTVDGIHAKEIYPIKDILSVYQDFEEECTVITLRKQFVNEPDVMVYCINSVESIFEQIKAWRKESACRLY